MKIQIVMLECFLDRLKALVFDQPEVEGAAFLLCGESRSEHSTKLVVHAVVPIEASDFLRREVDGLTITSAALMRISKLARYEQLSIIFAHSHPGGFDDFSEQDNFEEEKLLPFFQARIPARVHGTLVLTQKSIRGRLYTPKRTEVDSILVIGDRIQNWSVSSTTSVEALFDRQVRAFGTDIQRLLQKLHVGVVGLGGTGSPVAEQLYRLGVGRLSLFDGDTLDVTNVNRVYGSSIKDEGALKVAIAKRELERIGFNTVVDAYPEHITSEMTARALRDCDVIFGCTDKELPRAILTQLSLHYCIPVFDLGVLISSEAGTIRGVHGRVTTVYPGEACLYCRGRISAEAIRIEALSELDRNVQVRDGYAPELAEPAPAVIAFTSATASAALQEFLHRLTGFMGSERKSTETLLAFDQSRVRTNRLVPREDCTCSDGSAWGRGDCKPFLEMAWANQTK